MSDWAEFEMRCTIVPHYRSLPNLIGICSCLADNLNLSFSASVGHGKRQAASRLFSNPRTNTSDLLHGHSDRTDGRCVGNNLVLVVQDTTSINYTSHPATKGLGPINDLVNARGLHAHSALVVTPSGIPLGVAHLDIWARDKEKMGSAKERREKPIEQKESHKWIKGLRGIEKCLRFHLGFGNKALLIQDREADIYDFIAAERHAGIDLLIRAAQARNVVIEGQTGTLGLFDAIATAPVLGDYVVSIPGQSKSGSREATLEIRVLQVKMLAPENTQIGSNKASQSVYVIQASERASAEGKTGISWTLLSTMPVEDLTSARQMIEYYTHRWMIERLHFTLKSGLKIERLQFDDIHSLSNALAICWIIAWRIMYLTHIAREMPTAPVDHYLEADELVVLEQVEAKPITTVAHAVIAIAKLAGYKPTPKGGPPGVKSLWIGIRQLEAMVVGWKLAMQAMAKMYPLPMQ